jgi:hypothetical protein
MTDESGGDKFMQSIVYGNRGRKPEFKPHH